MWQDIVLPGLRLVAKRIVPLLVGALLGALADAGLLDGQVQATLAQFG